MKRFILFFTCASALTLSGCAVNGDQGEAITSASGSPEAYFLTPPEQTMGKLGSACMDRRGSVTESSANQVVCEVPMGAGQAIVTQLLIGNSYSTTPQEFIRFNIIPFGSGASRVQAAAWVETTMAFGQKQTVNLSTGRAGEQIQELLSSVGGSQTPPT
jgi:hypothetical protein